MFKAINIAFVIAAIPAVTSAQEPIAVGVMTQTGFLLPFVQIGRSSVTSLLLPGGDSKLEMVSAAKSLERSPWTLRTIADGATTKVEVTGRTVVDLGYEFHEAWMTTFKGKSWPSYMVPIPKIGLATRGVIAELPEDLAARTDADSLRVRGRITRLAHAREAQLLKAEPHHPVNQYSRVDRARKVVRLDKLWRRRVNGTDTYYFEATKRYEFRHLLLTGWIVVEAERMTPRFVTFVTSDDEYKQGVYRQVLGVIPWRQRELWVMESHYYEGEHRFIREWPSGKCVLGVNDDDCD